MATIVSSLSDFTKTYTYHLTKENRKGQSFIWEIQNTEPFEELIFSWNGLRPKKGKWTFFASLNLKTWSPWIRYAEWGTDFQKTFQETTVGALVESYQDAIYPKASPSTGFRMKVEASDGADLAELESLFSCVSLLTKLNSSLPTTPLSTVLLPKVIGRSQFKLDHPRKKDLCSPTATTTAIRYLMREDIDPVSFASKVHDDTFDIFGNWILNTAEANVALKGKYICHVERLPSFASIHAHLTHGLPVVVSVRGPLPGSSHPLTFGHLICVIGFHADTNHVLCIDSGFPENEKTFASYDLKDFIEAWGRRQNIAYVFSPKTLASSLASIMS